jgi:hypothetical protein
MFAAYPGAYFTDYNMRYEFVFDSTHKQNIILNTRQNNTTIGNNKRKYNDAFGQETYDYMRYGQVIDENYFSKGCIGHGVIQQDIDIREEKREDKREDKLDFDNLSKCIKMDLNDEEFEEGEIDERQNQDEDKMQDEYESETDKLRRSIDEKFNTLFSILNEIVII